MVLLMLLMLALAPGDKLWVLYGQKRTRRKQWHAWMRHFRAMRAVEARAEAATGGGGRTLVWVEKKGTLWGGLTGLLRLTMDHLCLCMMMQMLLAPEVVGQITIRNGLNRSKGKGRRVKMKMKRGRTERRGVHRGSRPEAMLGHNTAAEEAEAGLWRALSGDTLWRATSGRRSGGAAQRSLGSRLEVRWTRRCVIGSDATSPGQVQIARCRQDQRRRHRRQRIGSREQQ